MIFAQILISIKFLTPWITYRRQAFRAGTNFNGKPLSYFRLGTSVLLAKLIAMIKSIN